MFNLDKKWKPIMLYFFVIIFSLIGYAASEPSHEAAKRGDLDKVKRLTEEGANVNSKDSNSDTPLYVAGGGAMPSGVQSLDQLNDLVAWQRKETAKGGVR